MILLTCIRSFNSHAFKLLSTSVTSLTKVQSFSDATKFKKRTFNLDTYDCIGFDLDNTLCEYKVEALVRMEYSVMAEYLIAIGYNKQILGSPINSREMDFMQRGLLLDFERGNILKLNNLGEILIARHGHRKLSHKEVIDIYGHAKRWELTEYFNDMTVAWEPTSVSTKFRALLDFFDLPAALAFARAVDDLDNHNNKNYMDCGNDILAALQEMYSREHFSTGKGNFFKLFKNEPDLYLKKCSDNVINWLKSLNKSKILFLITGSNVDLCHFTASHCIGKDWKDLFDVVVCFARKPGFFKSERPFFATEDFIEGGEMKQPVMGKILSQGNWNQLHQIMSNAVGKSDPSCIYFGDNLVEDVYAPVKWSCCDAAAIVEEHFLNSDQWGKFTSPDTLWGYVINTYAVASLPSLSNLAALELNIAKTTLGGKTK